MMNTLLESRPQKKRSAGGTVFSVVFHSAIVLFAVFATARAGVVKDNSPKTVTVKFFKTPEPPTPVERKPEPPPAVKKPVIEHHNTPAPVVPPKGFQSVTAPVTIATKIPDIDLSVKAINPDDFKGTGVKNGTNDGEPGSNGSISGAPVGNTPFRDFQVERAVSVISGTNIPYPEGMRSSGVEGKVEAEFVVDENGRVQLATFKVLDATNDLFVAAVRNALSRMRFRPAKIGSVSVSQVVQQAFVFKLNR
ncbi:MAG: TonB family protein [Gemmatimonadales bacterium]